MPETNPLFPAQYIKPTLAWISIIKGLVFHKQTQGMHMHAGWMNVKSMHSANSIQNQKSMGTCEIVLDVLKSERNETNCVPAEVKAMGFRINLIEGKGLCFRVLEPF